MHVYRVDTHLIDGYDLGRKAIEYDSVLIVGSEHQGLSCSRIAGDSP